MIFPLEDTSRPELFYSHWSEIMNYNFLYLGLLSAFMIKSSIADTKPFEFKGEIQKPVCSIKPIDPVNMENISIRELSSKLKSSPFQFHINFYDCPAEYNLSVSFDFQADTYSGIQNKIRPLNQPANAKYGIGIYFKGNVVKLNTSEPIEMIQSENRQKFQLPLVARLEVLDPKNIVPGNFNAILNFNVYYD